jgi:hypothetical protein
VEESEELRKKLESDLRDLQKDADVMSEQREKANSDMRFINVDGAHWDDFLGDDFENRAKLEFDLISTHKNKFVGEWLNNYVGVEYKPDGDDTTDDDAEFLGNLRRSDYRDNSGEISIVNAIDEMATCGFGAYGISPRFVHDDDPEQDHQDIEWRPIYGAYNSIFFDRSSKRIDKKDARWVTEITGYTKEAFEEEFPGLDPVSAYTMNSDVWSVYSGELSEIYVATRYEIEEKKAKVFVYNNLATGKVEVFANDDHEDIKDELAEDNKYRFVRERMVMRTRVLMSRFTGKQYIEKARPIAGKRLPIIPLYAYRVIIDNEEHYFGLVRKLKDPNRVFDVQASQVLENSTSDGQEVPIFEREQMESQEVRNLWADKNNVPFLLVDAIKDSNGNIISAGPIGFSKPPMLNQNAAALLDLMPNFIREVTGGAPQDTLDPDASGKAINAIIKQVNLNTTPINKNIEIALTLDGEVYQYQASDVYKQKRLKRTLSKDGTEGSETLHKIIADKETGRLIEANTIYGKRFKAYPDVGPQYQTERERTVEVLKEMMPSFASIDDPDVKSFIPVMLSTIVDNISGVGLDPIKKHNRQLMLKQGLAKPETDEEKAYVQKMMQPKDDPNQKLMEAAAQQQIAEAKNLQAATIDKIARAKKKEAETQEIYSELGINQLNQLLNSRKQILRQ